MNFRPILLLLFFHNSLANENLEKYLHNKAQIVGEKLIESSFDRDLGFSLTLNKESNVDLGLNKTFVKLFQLFDKHFVLIDKNLYKVEKDKSEFLLSSEIRDEISFVKAVEFNQSGIILISTKNTSNLFVFNSNNLNEINGLQKITTSDPISDSLFFIQQSNLYLLTSTCKNDSSLAPTNLYKFEDTYFDHIQTELTNGKHRLFHFSDDNGSSKKREIILMLQHPQKRKMLSVVYEFKNNNLKKIQKLEIGSWNNVASYSSHNQTYVLITNANKNMVKIYLWTRSELIEFNEFSNFPSHYMQVFYASNLPFLVTAQNANLEIYSLNEYFLDRIFNSSSLSKQILATHVHINTDKSIELYLVENSDSIKISIWQIEIKINEKIQNSNEEEDEIPSRCLLNLEQTIYRIRNKIKTNNNKTNIFLRSARDNTASGSLLEETQSNFNDVLIKYENLQPQLQNRLDNSKVLIINDSVFNNSLTANQITANKDSDFVRLNEKLWRPQNVLTYKTNQTVSGPVKLKKIVVRKLKSNPNNKLFHELLLSSGNQSISGNVQVNNLDVNRLNSNQINNINMNNLYVKNKPTPIQGHKRFASVRAKKAKMQRVNGLEGSNVVMMLKNQKRPNYSKNLKIDNLHANKINDFDVSELQKSVFRFGIDREINGSLAFSSLIMKNANFASHANVLTSNTNQTIPSKVFIERIFTDNIFANRTNNIKIESIALFDHSTIVGPVTLDNYLVNNLDMRGELNESILLKNNDHIVGTNYSDFLQDYTQKVVIKGNLILNNIQIEQLADVTVNNRIFHPSNLNDYWTKSTRQTIPMHCEMHNGLIVPHLTTKLVNNIQVSNFMLNNNQRSHELTDYYFEDVEIRGNVTVDSDAVHIPDLVKLDGNAVRLSGTYNLKGRKTFKTPVKIQNLETDSISFVDETGSNSVSESKTFKNVIINANLLSEKVKTDKLNGVDLNELKNNTIFVDEDNGKILNEIDFEKVTATNLQAERLNEENVSKFISAFENLDNIDSIKNVNVHGSVTIANALNLTKINNFDVETLENQSPTKIEQNTIIGKLKFLGNVKVNNFVVQTLNNVDLAKLTTRLLYKQWDQEVMAPYTFTHIKTDNLQTNQINNITIGNLIDVRSKKKQALFAPNGLKFNANIELSAISGKLINDIDRAMKNMHNTKIQHWNSVQVYGNVTIWDETSLLSRIMENVVAKNKPNVIKGSIHFANHIRVNNTEIMKKINNIEIDDILSDALLKNTNAKQIVTGTKTFAQINAENAFSKQNIQAKSVNLYDIEKISNNLVSRNFVGDIHLKGMKTFLVGLQCKNVYAQKLGNILPEELVSFNDNKSIPHAMFETINVENHFNINFINNMPLNELIQNRLLKKTNNKQIVTANYFFNNNILIHGNMLTKHINDIDVNDVVFHNQNRSQIIQSAKTFTNRVDFVGDIQTNLLNGVKLSESFEQAALINEETQFKKTIIITNKSQVNGNINTNYINNVPINSMIQTVSARSFSNEAKEIYAITKDVTRFTSKNFQMSQNIPAEFLYLEKSTNLQINLPQTIDADVIEGKDHVLIHISGEEDGNYCGLPNECKCPVQYTMQITSEHSVNVFMEKKAKRIYTYYDQDIIIHFISNSVSRNQECRLDSSRIFNEMSFLSWNTHMNSASNATQNAFHVHQEVFYGFISDVKFFTTPKTTYLIVGTYYDPAMNSHNRTCDVYRFSSDKTSIEKIQQIQAEGVWTMSLTYTRQGVVLVIGKIVQVNGIENSNTEIYRFDEQYEQFELLRSLPAFGSLSTVGVVIGDDSLIVLANKHSTLHILKYSHKHDNYYFYQNLQFHDQILSMSVFYNQDFVLNDAYLAVVTKNNKYFIYSFMFIGGWKLESNGELQGLKGLIPFTLNGSTYLFAPSSNTSSLLTFVKHDSD